ncbi:MAG: plasmid recombination protein, partial [Oscillospiraceae bacterium]
MVGKGSVNHNSRKFRVENVDGERTHLNVDYCNEDIRKVYHEMFDEALKRYNEKQTRADRRIENYYEKIRTGKQEKPLHELILQIGDKENMSAESKNGELAQQILDEYYRGFQERNPQLRVFSAHLHMDEATPHLHIDFVPFTTGSKRGLDTRVSLKQALAAQGFRGGTRGDTEWNQWVQSEKEQLAEVMERHGIEWEHKGTHEKHLSVMDFKKQEREKEVIVLDEQIATKKDEVKSLGLRVQNFDGGLKELQKVEQTLEFDDAFQLPEPQGLMTAKTYKTRF